VVKLSREWEALIKIEIGGGNLLTPSYINLDPVHGLGLWKRYAQDTPWPTGNNTVDNLRASHVLEHIPAGMDHRVKVMNEAHRVLKPGGTFEIILPLVMVNNQWVQGWWAIADPTHVSLWAYPESFLYFCDGAFRANANYGIRYWDALDESKCKVVNGWEGHVVLTKPV